MEEIEELDLEIRPAAVEDFDTLTNISRICFPEELRWKARKTHSRKWWENLVDSNNCEIWVGSIYGKIVAFIVLIISREKYEEAIEKQHYSFLDALLMFKANPKGFFRRIAFRLKLRKLKNAKDEKSSTKDSQVSTYKKIKNKVSKSVPWCGPIAVLPGIRGRGISLKMMEQCSQRAKELGYKEIYTSVQKRNMMSRIMIAIVGFKVIEEIDYVIFYKKTL